jgi:hypothetical protein
MRQDAPGCPQDAQVDAQADLHVFSISYTLFGGISCTCEALHNAQQVWKGAFSADSPDVQI